MELETWPSAPEFALVCAPDPIAGVTKIPTQTIVTCLPSRSFELQDC